ncbi:unnamed protein product [Chrysodeixis includens]|uniref:Uncharacterized protein n=1 Tax=Chrysodeixis includens TaxID=689277 RepID=A0A9P0BM30_CHRIL|nr:unnamed protein product [Chrysodeixis includens]
MAYQNPSFIIKNIEPHSMKDKDNDLGNNWVNISIEHEVWRGKKLRREKPIPSKIKDDYDVININYIDTVCKRNRQRRRPTSASSAYTQHEANTRTTTTRKNAKQLKRCSMRIAELAVPTKRQCIDTWRNKSNLLPEFMVDRLKQHVMDQRPIVQIPEAIYCFQKRQRPHSAKNSFKSSASTRNNITHILKPLRQLDMKSLCIIFGNKIEKMLLTPMNLTLNTNLKNLSKVVACEIAQIMKSPKLIMEQDLCRSMQLEVANKVTVWISGILEDLTFKLLEEDLRVKKEDEAKAQTAEQLVKIMEKILRKQQRLKPTDLEEEEGPVLDFLDSVVDKVLNICEPPPVLIDESSSSYTSKDEALEEESLKSSANENDDIQHTTSLLDDIEVSDDIQDKVQEFIEELENFTEITDEEFIQNVIYKIIKNIDRQSDDENSEKSDFSENLVDEANKEFGEVNEDAEFGSNDDKESDDIDDSKKLGGDINEGSGDEIENEYKSLEPDEKENDDDFDESNDTKRDSFENSEQNDIIQEDDIADKKYSHVSDVFDIINEDLGDKDSRSVKLPITDFVNPDIENIRTSLDQQRAKTEKAELDFRGNTTNEKNRPNIVFAEPNEYLLSDADETWPAERPLLKISESVSKSVTSLGNIFESDDEDKTGENRTPDHETRQELQQTIMDNISSEQRTVTDSVEVEVIPSKFDIGSQTKDVYTTESKETTTNQIISTDTTLDTEPRDQNLVDTRPVILKPVETKPIYTKPIDKKPVDIKPTDKKPGDMKPFDTFEVTAPIPNETDVVQREPETFTKKPKYDEQKMDNKDTFRNKTGSSSSLSTRTEDDPIRSHKTQSHMDYSWKVHPKTAPSWVRTWGQGHGEPSEDSIPIQIRPTRVKESEMRKWSKDLEKAYINLAMWCDWIDSTCKETISLLKRKETACSSLGRKNTSDWIRLKKNINKDAILWTKLHQRTENNFKSLKRKYNNVEIVSAEYCAMCTCNKTRKNMNVEYVSKM